MHDQQTSSDETTETARQQKRRAYLDKYQNELRTKRKRLELSLHPDEHTKLKDEADRLNMKLATLV